MLYLTTNNSSRQSNILTQCSKTQSDDLLFYRKFCGNMFSSDQGRNYKEEMQARG